MFTTAGFTFATTAGTPVLCGWAWACCATSSSAISVEASFDLMVPSIANLFIIVWRARANGAWKGARSGDGCRLRRVVLHGRRALHTLRQPQQLLPASPHILGIGVEGQLRTQGPFVVQDHVRPIGQGTSGTRHRPLRPEMPARGALALATDLVWANELHLGEVRDELARQPPPCAARRARVHDDGNAGFGEELGRIRKRPVNDLPCRIRRGAVVEENLADRKSTRLNS